MCLILFAHRASASHPLLVAANRDEFHARPTKPASFWGSHPDLFAGRDLQAGGTWMGVSRNGRFAAITNYRDPERTEPALRTRGELTVDFLCGRRSAQDYLQDLASRNAQYAGFNLLLGEAGELWYYSNSNPDQQPLRLSPGIYGLSNATLDTPWPKVVRGKEALRELVTQPPNHEDLATTVSSRALAPAELMQAQGLDTEMDQMLSAQFIVNPTYGTRATTTLWQESDGTLQWREANFAADGTTDRVIEQSLRPMRPHSTGL